MRASDGAVDAGKGELRLSLSDQVRHDLVPHAPHSPSAEAQVGMVPVAQFGWDRTPLRPVVETPDNRLDRAAILGPRTGSTNLSRRDRYFELCPLGIGQDLNRLYAHTTKQITFLVTASSHEMRTDPRVRTHNQYVTAAAR
jgi:hypothetical protein